jgi:hypothetical protein
MVEQIGKRAFKPKAHPLGNMKGLRQSGSDRRGAGTLQNAYTAVSDRTRGNRIEGTDVENASSCRIRYVAIAGAVGTLECAPIGKTQIAGS